MSLKQRNCIQLLLQNLLLVVIFKKLYINFLMLTPLWIKIFIWSITAGIIKSFDGWFCKKFKDLFDFDYKCHLSTKNNVITRQLHFVLHWFFKVFIHMSAGVTITNVLWSSSALSNIRHWYDWHFNSSHRNIYSLLYNELALVDNYWNKLFEKTQHYAKH